MLLAEEKNKLLREASSSEVRGSASASPVAKASCCSGSSSKTDSGVTVSWDLAGIDINKGAGEFLSPYAPISLVYKRIIQNLCN
jgi:hypothetical protein